jgi:Rne/Rng family ribonuclease
MANESSDKLSEQPKRKRTRSRKKSASAKAGAAAPKKVDAATEADADSASESRTTAKPRTTRRRSRSIGVKSGATSGKVSEAEATPQSEAEAGKNRISPSSKDADVPVATIKKENQEPTNLKGMTTASSDMKTPGHKRRSRRGRRSGQEKDQQAEVARAGATADRAAEKAAEAHDESLPAGTSQRRSVPLLDDALDALVAARTAVADSEVATKDASTPVEEARRSRDRGRRRRGWRDRRREDGAAPSTKPPAGIDGAHRPELRLAAKPATDTEDDEVALSDSEEAALDDLADVVFPAPDLKERCKREMVINVTTGDECRIAILQDGRLEELFIERASSQSHVGNIYKGRITNVESSIQAAFVDFGLPKHGFLHISDVQPQYFPTRVGEAEEVGRKIPRHQRPPIQKCFRRGQEVMVQITKEGVGTKGPTLSTYLSIPGRYLVMMPGMNRHGVSRKIEDEDARRKMKEVMNQLTFPPGMGFILRTAGLDQNKRELQRDLNYLLRLWKRVVERVKSMPSPAELYRESDLVTRTIRDVYTTDVDRLIVDDPAAARTAKEFFSIAMPRSKPRIEVYAEPEPLFYRLGIEEEIERINARHVPLSSGGSLVIDSTEALVAIDVNSGRFRSPDDAEETAVRINVEAAEEIARQLRLRDLGGLIICDFIDMRLDRNKRKVERALRDALKKHKERARILRMSAFGLIEMTRQRQGPSIKRNIYFDCPHCRGSGLVKMPESVILDVMRAIQLAAHHPDVHKLHVTVATDVAYQILNTKRSAITTIEQATGKRVVVRGDMNFTIDQVECICEDVRGQPVTIAGIPSGHAPLWPAAR